MSLKIEIGTPKHFHDVPEKRNRRVVPDEVYDAVLGLKPNKSITFKSDKPNQLRSAIVSCIANVKKMAHKKKRQYATRVGYEEGTNIVNSVTVYRTK